MVWEIKTTNDRCGLLNIQNDHKKCLHNMNLNGLCEKESCPLLLLPEDIFEMLAKTPEEEEIYKIPDTEEYRLSRKIYLAFDNALNNCRIPIEKLRMIMKIIDEAVDEREGRNS